MHRGPEDDKGESEVCPKKQYKKDKILFTVGNASELMQSTARHSRLRERERAVRTYGSILQE